jgi:hypothetical protein
MRHALCNTRRHSSHISALFFSFAEQRACWWLLSLPTHHTDFSSLMSHSVEKENICFRGNTMSRTGVWWRLLHFYRDGFCSKNFCRRFLIENRTPEFQFSEIYSLNPTTNIAVRYVAVGWGTSLEAILSRGRLHIGSFRFSIDFIFPVALWPCGSYLFLTEMSTRYISWG